MRLKLDLEEVATQAAYPASWPKVDMTIASQVLENNQGYTEENDEG